jgi:two-component system cell cycle response regulator
MSIHVLLVESESEAVIFFQDVLTEIEAGRYWSNWVHIETLHAASWSEAAAILDHEPADVILLDLDLADSQGIDTFRRARSQWREIPVILLVGPEDGALAARLIRDGAQDFLFKKQVDCAPLAHAIRNAVERHRLLMAARAAAVNDPLTGLLNRGGFFTYADRDLKLAERLGRRLMVTIAEPKGISEIASAYGEQRRDLTLVEAADHLRTLAGATDLLGRIGAVRFGLTIFDTDTAPVEEVWARMRGSAAERRILTGAAVFDAERPASLEALLDQAAADLTPSALAMRR